MEKKLGILQEQRLAIELHENFPYHLESHRVVTKDGYILTLERVRCGVKKDVVGEPVLIAHGIIAQGSHWLLNSEEKCLPIILARAGYDCWLANFRGTESSKEHLSLDPNSTEFWDFSWDEMARFDLPSIISYILDFRGRSALFYVGHSLGCLVLFGALALSPELKGRIKKVIALAPFLYANNIRNFYLKLGVILGHGVSRVRSMYSRQVPLDRRTLSSHLTLLCPTFNCDKMGALLLSTIGVQLGMFSRGQVEPSRFPQISHHWPSTTSIKTLLHLTQLCQQQSSQLSYFRQYDYGKAENLREYGSEDPPSYNIANLAGLPICLFSSERDELAVPQDVHELEKLLGTDIETHLKIPAKENFSHIDFMIGKDADVLVYYPVLEMLQNQNQTHGIPGKRRRKILLQERFNAVSCLEDSLISRNPEGGTSPCSCSFLRA